MIINDDLRFFAQVVVVVLGWTVVHSLSATRDRRHARLEMIVQSIDAAWELSDKLLTVAFAYHGNLRHLGRELEIRMMFQDLMLRTISFSDLCSDWPELAACRNAIFSLRMSVTSVHFENRHIFAMPESDVLYREMSDRAMRVKRALLKLKHLQYRQR